MELSPGLKYLGQLLFSIALPSFLSFGVLHYLKDTQTFTPPLWVSVALIAGAKPLQLIVTEYATRIRHSIEARKRGARLIPRVREPWPYFGGISIVKQMLKTFNGGYLLEFVPVWAKEYGNIFELRMPAETLVVTTEPEYIKTLLATQFDNFIKGPTIGRRWGTFLGTGVFNSDGEMWKFHRHITRPFFTKERISDFDIFDKHADEALTLANDRLQEGYAIDFQDLVARFTLDSAAQFLFGGRIQALGAGIPYPPNSGRQNPASYTQHTSNTFVNAFASALHWTAFRMSIGNQWPLWEISHDRVRPHRKILDSIVEPIVLQAVAESEKEGDSAGAAGEAQTVLSSLVSQTKDVNVIKDELLNLLIAGRDTTACLLTYSVYMMAEHPNVAARLRDEILQQVGEKGRPSYDDIREMKYLRAFLNEVLRLYPSVPFDARTSINDTVFTPKDGSQPIFIPRDTRVGYSVWTMHRRKDLWGPDADEFDPDRFLDARLKKYVTPNPFIFTPFNAGPRICLGQQFAYQEASFFLVRLLQRFSKFSLDMDAQPKETRAPKSWAGCEGTQGREKIFPVNNLTLSVKGGLWVRME